MTTRRFRVWMLPVVLAVAAVTVILAMTFAGSATGQSSTTTLITVTGADFTPDNNTCDYERGGYSGEITNESGCDLEGSFQLPHGSTVLGVFVFYDSNGSGDGGFHFEENFWTGGHNDIANIELPECTPPDDTHPCVGFQVANLDSPDVLNGPFGYAGWLSTNTGFTLYKVVVAVSVPSGGGAAANPLTPPTKLPTRDTNPH